MISQRSVTANSDGGDRLTLVKMLTTQSQLFPDRLAFRFLEDATDSTITYRQLDQSARRIAASLQDRFEPGSSAAIVFPPGLGFVQAFFGCVYAGVLAIPATYPKPRRPSARLSAIVDDAHPAAMLTTERVLKTLHQKRAPTAIDQQPWLSIEELDSTPASDWLDPESTPDDIAFLQYTSGSTRDPRGVEVSHDNIAHNLEMIRQGFTLARGDENKEPEVGVSWLPAYHDMGLIGGILESLYVGGTTVLMSPLAFLQRPARWLKAISDHGAVVSGGPNFAYELCVRKIKPDELTGLDLSAWRVAFSGAEPIRGETLRRFTEAFAPVGFSDAAFYPCYGLAEATLLVTGGQGPGNVDKCHFDLTALQEHGRAVPVERAADRREPSLELVSCGRPLMGEEVLIVDPESKLACDDGVVGEIWIRGRNVARGYRNRPPQAGKTFNGRLADAQDDAFLRSGDLGFIRDGSLFVTGRRKELLIIRGRNHYPHDLEATVQGSNEQLIPGGGAAILIDDQEVGDELLVLVQEVDRATSEAQRETFIKDIRRDVTAEHDVFVHEVILIRTGTLPRTTSGKVRHADVKRQYHDGDLGIVSRWSFAENASHPERGTPQGDGQSSDLKQLLQLPPMDDREKLAEELQSRLMTWLRLSTDVPDDELDPHRPFAEYGLDSLTSVELVGRLEEGLELKLLPTVAWTYPTPAVLSRHLSELMTDSGRPDSHPPSAPDGSESVQSTGSRNGAGSPHGSDGTQPAEDAQGSEDSEASFEQLLSQLEAMPEEEVAAMLARDDHPEAHS